MSNSMTYRDALEFASRILPNQQIADGERYEVAKQELVTALFDYADSILDEYDARFPATE